MPGFPFLNISAQLLTVALLGTAAAPAQSAGNVQIHQPDHVDFSAPLEVMAAFAPRLATPLRRIPLRTTPPGWLPTNEPDTAVQSVPLPRTPLSATEGLSFLGVGVGLTGVTVNSDPPDTELSVGLTQVVQWVNLQFAVFDKLGNIIQGPTPGNAIWQGFGGPCEQQNQGDPIVLYDKMADRWLFSQFAFATDSLGNPLQPFYQCYALSTGSDARGPYFRWAYNFQSTFNDYAKHGVWPDAYYSTFNQFPNNGATNAPQACAIDRNAALAGTRPHMICAGALPAGATVLLPSDLDGSTPPPTGSPAYMVDFGKNRLNVYQFHVDFATPSNTTFTGPTAIAVAPFQPACNFAATSCIPQLATQIKLDSLGDRLMYRLAYRVFPSHQSLVVNHTITGPASAGAVRWYELRIDSTGTVSLHQQGTFAPDSSSRWTGSIAMDKAGDMALGYSIASSSVYPSIRVTGRTPADPLGKMETEMSIIGGSGNQHDNRWGDYSAMSVDPSDDCTFWYTNEYLQSTGSFNWSTRIATLKFPGCQ